MEAMRGRLFHASLLEDRCHRPPSALHRGAQVGRVLRKESSVVSHGVALAPQRMRTLLDGIKKNIRIYLRGSYTRSLD